MVDRAYANGGAMIRHLPNLLTILRLAAAPVIATLLLHGHYAASLGVFVFAGLSDAADGFLAKRYGFDTPFGVYLDPVADKLLMLVSFVVLTAIGASPLWLTVLVIARDVVIVSAIALARFLVLPLKIAPSLLGKASTAIQVCYIGILLIMLSLHVEAPKMLNGAAFAVGVMTLASWLSYAQVWLKALGAGKRRAA